MRLILFPHYDDEMFCIHHLRRWQAGAEPITIRFLTHELDSSSEVIRSEESRRHLLDLGITYSRTPFLDASAPADQVTSNLEILYSKLTACYDEVICPALEGGHPDHDAAFFLGLKLLKEGRTKRLLVYPTYSPMFGWGPLFWVGARIYPRSRLIYNGESRIGLRFCGILRTILYAFRYYPSQRRTWTLLALPWLIQLLFQRSERLYEVKKPEPGGVVHPWLNEVPLYERHGRTQGKNAGQACLDFYQAV